MALFGRPRELPPPSTWYDSSASPSWLDASSQDSRSGVKIVDQYASVLDDHNSNVYPIPPFNDSFQATKPANIIFDVPHGHIWGPSPTEFVAEPLFTSNAHSPYRHKGASSILSAVTSRSSSSAVSTWSSIHTDDDCSTIVPPSSSSRFPSPSAIVTPTSPLPMICLGPQCSEAFPTEDKLETHVRAAHTHTCKWVGCAHPSFASREGLIWHVESEHLLVCPCRGCDEAGFEDARLLRNHIAVGHPEVGKDGVKDWKLSKQVTAESAEASQRRESEVRTLTDTVAPVPENSQKKTMPELEEEERRAISSAKRKYQQQLHAVIEKRAKRSTAQSFPVQPRSPEFRQWAPARHRIPCRACYEPKSFHNLDALRRHYRVVHPELPAPSFQSQLPKIKSPAANSPSSFFPTPSSIINTPGPPTSNPGFSAYTPASTAGPYAGMTTPMSPLSTSVVANSTSTTVDKPVPFPLVFEHAILPFLVTFLPRWTGPEHVVSVTRGRNPQARRICIMTPTTISRARKILIAKHTNDLLPDSHRPTISFVFPVGTVDRTFGAAWARGLSREQMDDVCIPRNPFYFSSLCMGDSIGISGTDDFEETTATLGPCVSVGGGTYWLANFHPFVDAYQSAAGPIAVEHPSAQDREICVEESHDAVANKSSFTIGNVQVTSGMGLKTTRVTHDPYWDDYLTDQPLVVTDWALIDSRSSHANILRRFPIDYPNRAAPEREAVVRSTSAVVPGASVVSSGRTSGYGAGQICEIPAYVSGIANGTQKATREWFIEEAWPFDNEEDWIRGGIGVHGDSGAAVIDAETRGLVGQLWGRNKYWGPGPRHTFFTPIADIFDDIQEKCGQQTRPQLPQFRSEGDCYPVEPPCRTCYDTYRNLDSRRSSRMSLQSMVMVPGENGGEQDGLTSIEAASELATPRAVNERFPNSGLEEIGMTFGTVLWGASTPSRASQGVASPGLTDMRSPYAQTLELDDLQEREHGTSDPLRKRTSHVSFGASPRTQPSKRPRVVE